jgi:hypothetical protein
MKLISQIIFSFLIFGASFAWADFGSCPRCSQPYPRPTPLPRAALNVSDGATFVFGTVAVGGTMDKTLTLTNNGGTSATELWGSGVAAPFSFKGGAFPGTGGTCSTTLAASATCTFIITFSPTTIATFNDTVDISYFDGVVYQSASRNLTGTAVAPGNLIISNGPTFDFGTIHLGYAIDGTLTVANTGGYRATAIATEIWGEVNQREFEFKDGTYPGTGGTCSSSLAAGDSCEIVVTFAPVSKGVSTGTIHLGYNNGAYAQYTTRAVYGEAR